MTKQEMQAAGREDAASEDGAFAASILCTRTSINENMVRHLNDPSSMDRSETPLLRWH